MSLVVRDLPLCHKLNKRGHDVFCTFRRDDAMYLMFTQGVSFPAWPIDAGPTLQWVIISLSSSCHRLLNLPNMQRTMQRWRSVELAVIGQARKTNTPYCGYHAYNVQCSLYILPYYVSFLLPFLFSSSCIISSHYIPTEFRTMIQKTSKKWDMGHGLDWSGLDYEQDIKMALKWNWRALTELNWLRTWTSKRLMLNDNKTSGSIICGKFFD